VFDPKNRIHWVGAIILAVILILILGVASTGSGQEPAHDRMDRPAGQLLSGCCAGDAASLEGVGTPNHCPRSTSPQ